MDDKDKDLLQEEGVDKDRDALLSDDIPLDDHSDFVDEPVQNTPAADSGETLFSANESRENAGEYKPEQSPAEQPENAAETDGETSSSENTAGADEDTPVIDESQPAVPSEEEMNEALKPKLKETSVKKKKRIVIAVIAVLLVAAITLAIVLPIVFYYRDKIMVSSAEDFANYNDGKYFVLEKDVTVDGDLTIERLYNIDLNGHSLVVNGTLKYVAGTEGTLTIGTKKGKEYVAKGLLQANEIVFETADANVNLVAPVTVNTMTVTAKSFTLSSSAQANGTVTVDSPTINVNGPVSFGEGESAKFVAKNASAFNVNANVSSAVETVSSTLTLAKNATIGSLALDSSSRAAIYGKVSDSITTLVTDEEPDAEAPEGETGNDQASAVNETVTSSGNVVVLLGSDYSCPTVRNVNLLALERRSGLSIDVYDCTTVKYIDRLAAPVDINIDERADGSLVAVSSKVQNAQAYSFSVDGKDWVDVDGNEYDITAQLTSQTGTHRVEVYAKGNYSYSDPFALGDASVLYLDGEKTACEYTYRIQLATPSNLNVTLSVVEGKQVYMLTFDKVAFATSYEYYVNGVKYTYKPENDSAQIAIDITSNLPSAGAYSIRVVATADSADILTSKPAMTSTVKLEKLLTPTLSAVLQEDGKTTLTIQTTEGVSTTYLVTYQALQTDGSKKTVTLLTSNTTVSLDGLAVGDSITVTAQAGGYYTESDPSTVYVTEPAAEPTTGQ